MNIGQIISIIIILNLVACKDKTAENGVMNESDKYAICNDILADSNCIGGTGNYCLFGYKWGDNNSFKSTGYDNTGPKVMGGIVTFSFQESNGLVNTHSQINLSSKSFAKLIDCAKPEVRRALNAWSDAANINFDEQTENSKSDIRFFVADIRQSGIGYPNFSENQCNLIGGNVIIQANVRFDKCGNFYGFILHEIGHVLGLGHVNSNNIMNPNLITNFNELQQGDKQGILEIYGER